MKKLIFADPKKEWGGFRFTAYWLDVKGVLALPLTKERAVDGNPEKLPTTVGEIYKSPSDPNAEIDEVAGSSFNCQMVKELLKFRNEGINPFGTRWFWYDLDRGMTEPHDIYRFFVVYDGKIVRESIEFSDYRNSGFDPSVFEARDDREQLFSNQAGLSEAEIRFWYRKFYTGTQTGEIMVLRRDHPNLYDYELRRKGPDSTSLLENALSILTKIHALLWVLIVLVGLMLIRSLR